jgi:antitoxin FitA
MASITIRRLAESTKQRLRRRAARHGRSMEEEAREILKEGLTKEWASTGNLAEDVRRLFAPLGGVDLKVPPRQPLWEPPDFSGPEYDRP